MIIADENLDKYWIDLFRTQGYSVVSVAASHSGASDNEVIAIAKEHKGILITEDKDFGELIFAHGISQLTVLLLRYDQPVYSQIEKALLETIAKYLHHSDNCFITITKTKIRIRRI